MSDVQAGVFQYLSAQTAASQASYVPLQQAVAAIVGRRIFPGKIPQHHFDGAKTMPAIVTRIIDEGRQAMHCGTDGLVECVLQVDCYAPVRDDVPPLADAIRRAMVDYSGRMGDLLVSKVLLTSAFDALEPDPGLYGKSQTYSVWHSED